DERWSPGAVVDYEVNEHAIVYLETGFASDYAEAQIANDNLGAQNYFDVNAVFRFMQTRDVTIGVNNVFDKEPPLMGNSLSWNANTVLGFYDTLGRYLYANVTLRW
ncbi:MAG TPA: hypothetical protein VIS57_03860, partial [Xanthomonadales bacterium]